MEWEIGAPGKAYTKWAADMAVKLGTGVPWIMCKQEDAPDPMVSNSTTFYFFFTRLIFAFTGSFSWSVVDLKFGLAFPI